MPKGISINGKKLAKLRLSRYMTQPEELQRGILGLYGKHGPDITRMAMESLAKERGRKNHNTDSGEQPAGRPAAQPSIAPAVHASHAKPALSNGEMLGVMLNRILSGLCYAAGILYFVSYVINLILASQSGAETLNTAGIAEYFVAVRCLIAFGVGTLFQLAAGQILTRAAIRSLHR